MWVRVPLQSFRLQIRYLFRARGSLRFRHLQSEDSLWNVYVSWWEHTVKCPVQISNHKQLSDWSIWLNGWVFVYELSGCGFESCCSHLNVRYGICFKQGDLWYSGNYKMWIHSEKRTWHDKNIQSNIQAISSCCSKHRKNTENKDPKVSNTKNKTIMLWRLQCALAKNLSLLKNKKQQINEHLGIRVPLNKIPLLGNILLYVYKNE